MHFEKAQERMIEEQLLPRGITDQGVLEAMRKVPRHLFVDKELWNRAYDDCPLPIGEGQTISQPYMVAVMTEELGLSGGETVLEIGTGSGYQSAILAEIAGSVFTVERIERLAQRAKELLERLGYTNIALKVGDGTIGWEEHSPYDAILITAGAPDTPRALFDQLRESGRIVVPLGSSYSQVLTVVENIGGRPKKRSLFGCVFVPLIGEYGWREEY